MNKGQSDRQALEVLLVEDQPGDALLVQESFRRGSCPVHVSHVGNADECLLFLDKAGRYLLAPTPHLLLLDLLLPATSGRELMEILLSDGRFRHLPVVVLTAVADERSVREMYALRCSTYIVKPLTFHALRFVTDMIGRYWAQVATLPKTDS